MPPMLEYLDLLQTTRVRVKGQAAFIKELCKQVAAKVQHRRKSTATDTPGRLRVTRHLLSWKEYQLHLHKIVVFSG